jgi:mono/diheme cytochrome c family protein
VKRGSYKCGWALCAIFTIACGGEAEAPGDPAVARGEKIYRNVCVVCHNPDPNQSGALGPDIAGAARDLLEAKVLRGEYPAGYTPKRNTKQMPKFDFLEPNIDDIAAFLADRRG